jgi:hypothetical protein
MDEPARTAPDKRLGDRAKVRRAAIVIKHRKRFGRVKEELIGVEVRDVSVTGALLAVPAEVALQVGHHCELEITGARGETRIRRVEPAGETLLCGIEFVDPRPAFLPTIYQWLGRDDLDDTQMY